MNFIVKDTANRPSFGYPPDPTDLMAVEKARNGVPTFDPYSLLINLIMAGCPSRFKDVLLGGPTFYDRRVLSPPLAARGHMFNTYVIFGFIRGTPTSVAVPDSIIKLIYDKVYYEPFGVFEWPVTPDTPEEEEDDMSDDEAGDASEDVEIEGEEGGNNDVEKID